MRSFPCFRNVTKLDKIIFRRPVDFKVHGNNEVGVFAKGATTVYEDGYHKVDASASAHWAKSQKTFGSSVDYSHSSGHGASVSGNNQAGVFTKGTATVYNSGDHKVNASASAHLAKPHQTFGTSIDYSNNRGLGASISVKQTPQLKQKEVAVGANVNLFKNDKVSVDANVNASRDNHGGRSYNGGVGVSAPADCILS